MGLKKYYDFINEATLGTETIHSKYYSNIDKKIFYKIINIDPTTVRKKDFSKPGKYSKWLIQTYKNAQLTNDLLGDEKYIDNLSTYLFIFSTNWFRNKFKENQYAIGGVIRNLIEKDINKYSLHMFVNKMMPLYDEYLQDTENAKFDIVYSDNEIDIYVPLNFTSARETAANTAWCSKNFSGFSNWNQQAILFRIMPKDDQYNKIKYTHKYDGNWFIASHKYPELIGKGDPFGVLHGKECWLDVLECMYDDMYESGQMLFREIEKTMNLVSDDAKKCMQKYYDENKK